VKNTCEFIKNDNILENKKLLLKDIQYFFAIENIPICQQKWEIYFGVELPWEEIWGRRFKNLANRKSKQLQWKVIHRIIYTEERLQKMNTSPNGSCHFCKDPENLIHLFVNCKLVDSVWNNFFLVFSNISFFPNHPFCGCQNRVDYCVNLVVSVAYS
jgi:hypothetical protein